VVLKDRVAELIKDAILTGKLEPGDRIVEMKVASDMGVGTTAVREALFELESQGFVSRITNKGTFVTKLTPEDIEQIYRVRRELEGLAAELLQGRASEEDLAHLDHLTGEMRKAGVQKDREGFYRWDMEFHRTIWELSGNRYLARALDNTVVPLFAFFLMRRVHERDCDLAASADRHREIVKALREGRDARKRMEAVIHSFAEAEQQRQLEARRA
jgi:DNA-binding GntR family transcriptional regulator